MAATDELISALRNRRETAARELAALLGVSRPTLTRLVAAAGDQVCRMGRGKATRYALTRSLPTLGTVLPVRQIDEQGAIHPFGMIHLLANGRHWLETQPAGKKFLSAMCPASPEEQFEGLPPFAWDMSPQGYIGRNFPTVFPELHLPPRISDWNDDHRLIATARRGEDCVGNLIIGDESFSRFLADSPRDVPRQEYPEFARRSLVGQPGSSAGGEHPKFAVFSEGRHVLVKFASGEVGPVTQRWRDMLVCEREALETLHGAGVQAAAARLFDIDGIRFLEVDRFDRVGTRGRKGMLSLFALAVEYLGHLESWTRAAHDLYQQRSIDDGTARTMRWLDVFGQLIGNTDRHFGNVSFLIGERMRLAPAYDMLPMIFAPQGVNLVERPFQPLAPAAVNFDVWADAAHHAAAYWGRLAESSELSAGFRQTCLNCQEAVRALAERVPRQA